MTWPDLKEYADFNQDFLTWTQGEMKAGKSVDDAAAAYQLPVEVRRLHRAARAREGERHRHLRGTEEVDALARIDGTEALRSE